jgi:hypothetical protein
MRKKNTVGLGTVQIAILGSAWTRIGGYIGENGKNGKRESL